MDLLRSLQCDRVCLFPFRGVVLSKNRCGESFQFQSSQNEVAAVWAKVGSADRASKTRTLLPLALTNIMQWKNTCGLCTQNAIASLGSLQLETQGLEIKQSVGTKLKTFPNRDCTAPAFGRLHRQIVGAQHKPIRM